MPIYEYRCRDCEQIFEEWQKDFEEREISCPVCGGRSERLVSSTSFVLKGSGWYASDYCAKSGGEKKGEAAQAPAETKSDSGQGKGCVSSCPPSGSGASDGSES